MCGSASLLVVVGSWWAEEGTAVRVIRSQSRGRSSEADWGGIHVRGEGIPRTIATYVSVPWMIPFKAACGMSSRSEK